MIKKNICKVKDILSKNSYLGRGIIIGKSKDKVCIAYFLSGRSENSKNRVLVENNNSLITKAFDESKMKDPSLVIYCPLKKIDNKIIISNGEQTNTIYEYLSKNLSFEQAINAHTFEPDPPIYTPRISALIIMDENEIIYKLSILKSTDNEGKKRTMQFFNYESIENTGHFIHTYQTIDDVPYSFYGEPKTVYIPQNIDEFTQDIWNNLNKDYRISLFTSYTDIKTKTTDTRIVNINK